MNQESDVDAPAMMDDTQVQPECKPSSYISRKLRVLEPQTKPLEEYNNKELAEEGERIALAFYINKGYEILATNWVSCKHEVDIIAYDKERETVVLCEVKTRLNLHNKLDIPEIAVDAKKQKIYRKLALLYLSEHVETLSIRFDVIAINIIGDHNAKLRHLVGAFWWDN